MNHYIKILILAFSVSSLFACSDRAQTEKLLNYFLEKHADRVKPIQKQFNETIWETYSGEVRFNVLLKESNKTDSLYLSGNNPHEYYQNLLYSLYNNQSELDILENINKSNLVSDPLLKRQFEKVFRDYIAIKNDWDETEKHRTELLDKFYDLKRRENTYFDSMINEPASLQSAKWIGEFSSLSDDFRDMIKALNRDVKVLGFDNYFNYIADNLEISSSTINTMIDSVEKITRADYLDLLSICNSGKCNQQCEPINHLTPFQFRCAHSRMIYPREWNGISYSKEGLIHLLNSYFALGALDISEIYKKSDIWYNKEKINNNFFMCVSFDDADFRVYSNSEPLALSLSPLMHEFAHALHCQSVDKNTSYFLKNPNEIISEGVAMYLDSKIYTSNIIQDKLGLPQLEKNIFYSKLSHPSKLMLMRKLLRNIMFEKEIYENPDQDFNDLWWNLNKKYLFIDPAPNERLPEWITSFHIVGSDGINIEYLFAAVFAAQLEHYFPDDQFSLIKSKVMRYGDSLPWYELIKLSTGEPLNLKYLPDSYKRTENQDLISFNCLPINKYLLNNQNSHENQKHYYRR